jgi:hypothetical protein
VGQSPQQDAEGSSPRPPLCSSSGEASSVEVEAAATAKEVAVHEADEAAQEVADEAPMTAEWAARCATEEAVGKEGFSEKQGLRATAAGQVPQRDAAGSSPRPPFRSSRGEASSVEVEAAKKAEEVANKESEATAAQKEAEEELKEAEGQALVAAAEEGKKGRDKKEEEVKGKGGKVQGKEKAKNKAKKKKGGGEDDEEALSDALREAEAERAELECTRRLLAQTLEAGAYRCPSGHSLTAVVPEEGQRCGGCGLSVVGRVAAGCVEGHSCGFACCLSQRCTRGGRGLYAAWQTAQEEQG